MKKIMELIKIDDDFGGYAHVGCPVLVRYESITYKITLLDDKTNALSLWGANG